MAITYTWKVNNGLYTYITDPSYLTDEGTLPESLTNESYGYVTYGEPDNNERQKMQSFVKRYFTGDTGYELYERFYSAMLTKLRAFKSPKYKNVEFPSAYDSYYAASCDVNFETTEEEGEGSCKCCYYQPEENANDYTLTYRSLVDNALQLDDFYDDTNQPMAVKYDIGGFTQNMTFESISGMSFSEFINVLLFADQVVYPLSAITPSFVTHSITVEKGTHIWVGSSFGDITYKAELSPGTTYKGTTELNPQCPKIIELTAATVDSTDITKEITNIKTSTTEAIGTLTLENTYLLGELKAGCYKLNAGWRGDYGPLTQVGNNDYGYPQKSNGDYCDYTSAAEERSGTVGAATWKGGTIYDTALEICLYCVYPIKWNANVTDKNLTDTTKNSLRSGTDEFKDDILVGSNVALTPGAVVDARSSSSGSFSFINPLTSTITGLKIAFDKNDVKGVKAVYEGDSILDPTSYSTSESGNYYIVEFPKGLTSKAVVKIVFSDEGYTIYKN